MSFLSRYRWPALMLLLFGGFYLALTLGNHVHFGTSGWDLGIFQQTLYHYAHGFLGPNTVRRVPTLLADHFEPIMFLLAPFWWIFREWTLLFVQVIAIMIGGAGVFAVINDKERPQSYGWGLAGMALFFVHWSLIQAITFDYHNNVIAAMLLPWLLWCVLQRRWLPLYILAALVLLCKETSSLLICALGLGMLPPRSTRRHGLVMTGLGILWYLLSVQFLIPLFAGGQYNHWVYQALGQSAGQAVIHILTNPVHALSLLFDQEEKLRFWKYLLISGGILLLRWPRLALLAAPLIAMKMFSSEPNHWSVWFHYQAELASLTAIAVGWTCLRLDRRLAVGLVVLVLGTNLFLDAKMTLADGFTPFRRMIMTSFSPLLPWQQAAYKAMALIPPYASVSTQNVFIPHLAGRKGIYLFPDYGSADFVLLHTDAYNVWPLADRPAMAREMQDLEAQGTFQKVFEENNILLYKR